MITTAHAISFYDRKTASYHIPGYPGTRKQRDTEVRLMRGKIFRGKIKNVLAALCRSQLQF